MRTENERFRAAKTIIDRMDPKLAGFLAEFFSFHFRDGLQPKIGPRFRSPSAIETAAWIWVFTHHRRQQALRYTENSSSTKAASICQASIKTCAACCALLPPRHVSGITTSRWDVVVVIVSIIISRAAAMLRNHNFCLVEDEEGSRRLGDS